EVRTIKTNWAADPDPAIILGMKEDINVLALQRKNAVINIRGPPDDPNWIIHYNNGVTQYDETIVYWDI
ncbi:MAG: hypothetical protein WCK53_14485, partial [Methanomicrobiales archaeon]